MRISTMQSFNSGLRSLLDNGMQVKNTQQQISSGRKILTPADDPVASTRILQLQQDLSLRQQYQKNITAATNRQSLEDATLNGVTENVARIRELVVSAGNGATTREDRSYIALEIDERLDALVDLMNTKDASNEYIFGGFKGDTLPFQMRAGGGYEYKGDDGQRQLTISSNTRIETGDNGKNIFVDVPAAKNSFDPYANPNNTGTGVISRGIVYDQEKYDAFYPEDIIIEFNDNAAVDPAVPNFTVKQKSDGRPIDGLKFVPYSTGETITVAGISIKLAGQPNAGDSFIVDSSPKQSLTDTVQRISEGLKSLDDNPLDSAALTNLLADTLTNLDNAQTAVSETRSKVGGRLNTLENIQGLHADVTLVSQDILSKLQDVDFAEAVSRLSLESFLLEASQQSFAKISNLSLFNQL
ncbi:MAG: flagellar hook-associated protein FlgL [Alphaproteobacteria bacterium]|nr:flagellar hook-associated protein FlgL [Alphaproteobacteria bacterium]